MNEASVNRIERAPVRAVIDTSALVAFRHRRQILEAAAAGVFVAIWSPWIIAELNRILTWLWIERERGDRSPASQRNCSLAAKTMMTLLLPAFELVAPLPPYPPAWVALADRSDVPIWAAAKIGRAGYVVSENRRDFPPAMADGHHVYEGITYLSTDEFFALLVRAT